MLNGFLALLIAQQDTAPTQVVPPAVSQFSVSNPIRLAMTPKLDGIIEAEEWDPLATGVDGTTYMQWEPGVLYFAGTSQSASGVKISLDLNGDGWLAGDDNYEVRLTPQFSMRRLINDATTGASWAEVPLVADTVQLATANEGTGFRYELQIPDTVLPKFKLGQNIGVRVDAIGDVSAEPAPYAPRQTSTVRLAMERASGIPAGLEWAPEYITRTVSPGQAIKIRLNFVNKGEGKVGRIDLRTSGFASVFTGIQNLPFPEFDRKGRAFVDYDARVANGAPFGYTVLNARLTNVDGTETSIQSSYRITDILNIEPNLKLDGGKPGEPRVVKGEILLRSASENGIKGKTIVDAPEGWAVRKGGVQNFSIYQSRGLARIRVELIVPAEFTGLVPLPIRVQVGEREIEKIAFIVIK